MSIHKSRQRIAGRKIGTPAEYQAALDKAVLDRVKLGVTSPSDIGQQLGKHRTTIYRHIQNMAQRGVIQLSQSGRIEQTQAQQQQAIYRELQFDAFVQDDPSVKRWVDDMLVRRNGKPLVIWASNVSALKKMCDVLKVPPSAFLASAETAQELYKSFVLEFRKESDASPHRYKMPLRNFCMHNGITWARGVSGLMSGKKESFGKYAHIQLTEDQIKKGMALAQTWGDIDLRDFFAIGKETAARHIALRDMDISTLEAHEGYLTMRAFESKTSKTWTKYIVDPLVQRFLMERVERQRAEGKTKLFQNHVTDHQFSDSINQRLKKLYLAIGANDPYFQSHPTHALRHIGAHHWLRLTNYNYALVAKIGGWDDVSTLVKCYGEMPGEVIIQAVQDARKTMLK